MTDHEIKTFIEKCLVPASERLSAKELLVDVFFQTETPQEMIRDPLLSLNPSPRSIDLSGPLSMDVDSDYKQLAGTGSNSTSPHYPVLEFLRTNKDNEFRLKGKKNDDSSVSLTLRIADSYG